MINAVILDRDGTLIEHVPYLSSPHQVRIIDGVIDALLALKKATIQLFIATNQSGIGRGLFTECDYQAVTRVMVQQFADHGIQFERILHCPYHPDYGPKVAKKWHDYRKPNSGMIKQIMDDHQLAPQNVIMVGDSDLDVMAGQGAGVQSALVKTGPKTSFPNIQPDHIGDTLQNIVYDFILTQ